MARLCRKYSALSLLPTTASSVPCDGDFQNKGLTSFADASSSFKAVVDGCLDQRAKIEQAGNGVGRGTGSSGSDASNARQSVASMQAAR